MISRKSGLSLRASLVLGVAIGATAAPSVNVALRASFNTPPFLLELLETAAEENATSYFPLLDRIADGYFDSAANDKELYDSFRDLIKKDGHLSRAEDLSSFDFALSIHSTAPRIEAHHQYYNTSVSALIGQDGEAGCESWVYTPFTGQRHCSPEFEGSTSFGQAGDALHTLPFDRVLGDAGSEQTSVLYADILSDSFREFHKTISKTAKEGKTSYRVRYKPSKSYSSEPLTISGYGVELQLKRTDYIVIDDRQKEDAATAKVENPAEATLVEEEVSDLRPLSASELLRLDMKAASFVMASDSPLDTLEKLSQDFPKHSSSIAAVNVSREFSREHTKNREIVLPPGFNALWINGVQILGRDVDAFSLLEHLRKERKMINTARKELGSTAPQAIDLLSHESITNSQVEQEAPRYDWRDDHEGGNVIIWMNNIEEDERYESFPSNVASLLQRTYRGQLPMVRKDIHNVVIPTDFSDLADVALVVESLQNFVERRFPIRFGLVPRLDSEAAIQQAKVVYHLVESYGLTSALYYLGESLAVAGKKFGPPLKGSFDKAAEDEDLLPHHVALTLEEVLTAEDYDDRIKSASAYLARFGTDSPPNLVNGVAIAQGDEMLQTMSEQLSKDVNLIQREVYEGKIADDDYISDIFLYGASLQRLPLVVPENDKEIRHLNLGDLPEFADLPSMPASADTIERELVHITVIADLSTQYGMEQLIEALLFQREHDNVEVALLQTSDNPETLPSFGALYGKQSGKDLMEKLLQQYDMAFSKDGPNSAEATPKQRHVKYAEMFELAAASIITAKNDDSGVSSNPFSHIIDAVGLGSRQRAIIYNGRIVGPIPYDMVLDTDGLEVLHTYERKRRLLPASLSISALGMDDKATTPLAFAKISNLVALSQVSNVPEGMFEGPPNVRMSVFKQWETAHTAIKVGDLESSSIQLYAAVDPASELAQRWIPIIKTLSQLDGVYTCLFLNPREQLQELPVKRFYRHVIESKPSFNADGSRQQLGAQFKGLPAEALLNTGMDLPASWVVTPRESVHDPDNIKLSAVKTDIETIYELEHILIEGHSTDVTMGPPPRGAQLVLGTERDPHFADTIIMANLGYFQFKANPGVYNLALQKGRSEEIFHIDSAGTLGYNAHPGDNGTEIALMSFRGATVFPRLSRNDGMDTEDVLETSRSPLGNLAEGADKLLAQAGARLSNLFGGADKDSDVAVEAHADINIFSVASGHLYERMLNIMMVSVMKHTKHSVKFWFIEQFLSPSFKDFLPVLAAEYGFRYEMVTYKWPHWLRGQKEKQREIWGYKILFLDVLFPLDLDKVIFVDADQIVRTDMYELVQHDLKGAPYGFTPMCDSRTEMEGFRFWKQGYWERSLQGLPYHISALYVVDLRKFRELAAGDRLRQHYQMLSADPNSLSNLDQDLPNSMQMMLPIHSLPQEWLWCETWCSDESLKDAKTIDLCNNPQTKEPKLDRARRQVPEWTVYDDEIAGLAKRHKDAVAGRPIAGDSSVAGAQGEESIQERLQREDAERERKEKKNQHDEL